MSQSYHDILSMYGQHVPESRTEKQSVAREQHYPLGWPEGGFHSDSLEAKKKSQKKKEKEKESKSSGLAQAVKNAASLPKKLAIDP